MGRLNDKQKTMLEEAIENIDGVEIREDYSGRGMMGETCFGIVIDSQQELFGVGIKVGSRIIEENPDDADVLLMLLAEPRIDSMGKGSILYYPNTAW